MNLTGELLNMFCFWFTFALLPVVAGKVINRFAEWLEL